MQSVTDTDQREDEGVAVDKQVHRCWPLSCCPAAMLCTCEKVLARLQPGLLFTSHPSRACTVVWLSPDRHGLLCYNVYLLMMMVAGMPLS